MLAWVPSGFELLIFLAIVLLLFGNRLPTVARSFGQSINEFKKGMKEIEDHSKDDRSDRDR